MATSLSICRQVAAFFAAACSLIWGGAAAAQVGDYVAHEDDTVLLQLQVKNYRLANELRGYQTPGGICIDLADLIQALDMPVRLDKKSRRATGWLFAEDQTFILDRDTATVQIKNSKRNIQPGEIHDTPEGWCVDTRSLAGWLSVDVTADLRNSALRIESETPLPFVEAIERQNRAARLRPARGAQDLSAYPAAQQSYSMWRMPSVDVVAEAAYDRRGSASRLNTRYEIFASGELAKASFDVRLASDEKGVPNSLRMRAYRLDPDGQLLGPLKATQAVVGDVEMISGNIAGATGVGRGAFLGNRALDQADRFGTTVLRGTLPLGWDAELYRNGQLLAFQNNSPDGRYEFEVNLLFGHNDLEVVLYGPQGQIRRESRAIEVGAGSLPPGKLEYWAGVMERNHDLISFGRPPPASRYDDGWQFGTGVQYGLDRRTVIGANAHSLYFGLRRRNYIELNLQRAIGPMLANFSAAHELGQGRAYRLDMLGRIGKVNIKTESLFIDGEFTSGLVGPEAKSAHNLSLDTIFNAGRTPVPVSAGFRRTTERGGRTVDEYFARASVLFPRVSFTGYVAQRDSMGGVGLDDGTQIGVLANTRFLGFFARGEANYRLNGPAKGFESAKLSLEKALSERSDLRLDIDHNGRSGVTEFDLAFIRQFRKLDLRVGGHLDTNGGVGGKLAISFSMGPDPLSGGWRISNQKLAQRGHAAISVFLDEDGDGRRSANERALPGVEVNAGRGGTSVPTDEAGHTFVEDLQPYQKVLVGIDESTLPDPFLVARSKGVVVTPRHGVASIIELAVSPTGEVEGTIHGLEGTALAGARLELVDRNGNVAAQTISEYDGFFLFDRVIYGKYQLRLAAQTQVVLGAQGLLVDGIEVGPGKSVDDVGTVRLSPASQIAAVP